MTINCLEVPKLNLSRKQSARDTSKVNSSNQTSLWNKKSISEILGRKSSQISRKPSFMRPSPEIQSKNRVSVPLIVLHDADEDDETKSHFLNHLKLTESPNEFSFSTFSKSSDSLLSDGDSINYSTPRSIERP